MRTVIIGVAATLFLVALLLVPSICLHRHEVIYEHAAIRSALPMTKAEIQHKGERATLQELGPNGSALIDSELSAGRSAGYRLDLKLTNSGYSLNAMPLRFGKTGLRCFHADEAGEIHQNWGPEPATRTSPVLR